MTFEWDARKAAANFKKHGVTLEDGSSVFFNLLAITYPDPDHSLDETPGDHAGLTIKKEIVLVSHCERGERISLARPRRDRAPMLLQCTCKYRPVTAMMIPWV